MREAALFDPEVLQPNLPAVAWNVLQRACAFGKRDNVLVANVRRNQFALAPDTRIVRIREIRSALCKERFPIGCAALRECLHVVSNLEKVATGWTAIHLALERQSLWAAGNTPKFGSVLRRRLHSSYFFGLAFKTTRSPLTTTLKLTPWALCSFRIFGACLFRLRISLS